MSAVTAPSQCPIHYATSALDSIDWGISVVNEIASMVDGIQAMAGLPLDGVTLAQLKKRVTSLDRLALLTVRFADGRSDILGENRDQAQGVLDRLKRSVSECWVPVVSGERPPFEQTVVAWDNRRGKPCAVWLNPDAGGWFSQEDGSRYDDDDITHWRYCNAPDGIDGEGGNHG